MIPKEARPHEVAILMIYDQGKNTKQVAYELHYKRTEPVRRVIVKYRSKMHSPVHTQDAH